MANEIRVHTSCEVIQDVGDSAGAQQGITYSNKQLDGNADSRTWGGNYNISTTYTDADVCYWKNVVVSATAADGLNDSGWTEASDVTDGSIPTTAHVIAVEYVSQTGTAVVAVQIFGQTIATLSVGQSVVIPIDAGEAVADIDIFSAAYSSGVHEATVNVMIAGV